MMMRTEAKMTQPRRPHVHVTPFCETFMDHDFGPFVVTDRGRHPQCGPYETRRRTCRRCPRTLTETHWLEERTAARAMGMLGGGDLPPVAPLITTTEDERE